MSPHDVPITLRARNHGACRWWQRATNAVRAVWRPVVRWTHCLDPALRQHAVEAVMLGGTHLTNPVATRPTSLGQHPRWVIFVHGFGGHRGNFLPMRSYFHWRGQPATVSVGFRQNQSIESMAEELRGLLWRWIEEAPSAHLTFDLVGHSMGGILCRLVLEDPELAQHIRQIITLATPHRVVSVVT